MKPGLDTPIVDMDRRTVSPRAFVDPDIYAEEQARIFGRCWLYLGHDSEIPEPNSFVSTYMGNDPVILWRGPDGELRAFLNSCTHRGVKICRVDKGKARSFTCPYHGWTFNSTGALSGVPARERYPEMFDPADWSLIPVAQVASYAGLIFGNFDRDAESLEDFLGDIRWYLDTQFKRTAQGRVVFPGVQKLSLDVNWKLASEQFAGDNLHVHTTHRSAKPIGMLGSPDKFHKGKPLEHDFAVSTAQGHGWANLSPDTAPETPLDAFLAYEAEVEQNSPNTLAEKQRALTQTGAVGFVFPNFAFISFLGGFGLRMFVPKGPTKTDVWIWSGADAEAPEWRKELSRELNIRSFSAGGIVDADDVEMWMAAQQGMAGSQRRNFPMNYQLGADIAPHVDPDRPGRVDALPIESGPWAFYTRYNQLMGAGPARLAEAAE